MPPIEGKEGLEKVMTWMYNGVAKIETTCVQTPDPYRTSSVLTDIPHARLVLNQVAVSTPRVQRRDSADGFGDFIAHFVSTKVILDLEETFTFAGKEEKVTIPMIMSFEKSPKVQLLLVLPTIGVADCVLPGGSGMSAFMVICSHLWTLRRRSPVSSSMNR